MSWNAVLEWIIEVGSKSLYIVGGFAIIMTIAKLLGVKWVDLLFEKYTIRYKLKHDKELAFKSTQYNSLVPQQQEIATELHRKILRLHQSTKLIVELFDSLKKGFIKEPLNGIEEMGNFEFEFNVIPVNKESKEMHRRVFTMDEIERIGNYNSIKKEVEEYILQNDIYVPKDISDKIQVTLFIIELFVNMNFPKEFIHYRTQNKLNREDRNNFVNQIEDFKQSVGFDNVDIPSVIDSSLDFIKEQLRTLIGVENSNQ